MVMELDEALFWAAFGIMCASIVAIHSARLAVYALVAAAGLLMGAYAYKKDGFALRESFAPRDDGSALRESFAPRDDVLMCADSSNSCARTGGEMPIGDQGIDPSQLKDMPLTKCNLYLTDNVAECDEGLYDKHILELKARRQQLEAAPESNRLELERIDKVLKDAARLPRRQCKYTMSNWVRPYHSTMPTLMIKRDDFEPRGNPRHWAYCFAPMDRDDSSQYLKRRLERNSSINGDTIVRSGAKFELSNGVENDRVEFATMEPEQIRQTYCAMFYPQRDSKLADYYQLFKTEDLRRFFAMDMTPEGVIRGLQIYNWEDGALTLVSPATQISVYTCQDDTSDLGNIDTTMEEKPDKFNLEMSHYCGDKPLRKTVSLYKWMLRQLYSEEVSGQQLRWKVRGSANAYAFRLNICDRVDAIKPISADIMEMLGNAPDRVTVVHGNAGKSQDALCVEKSQKRKLICDLNIDMTKIYKRLQQIYEAQRVQGHDYMEYGLPDSGTPVVMKPETIRRAPTFAALRTEQLDLENKFTTNLALKRKAMTDIRGINARLVEIETNINNAIDAMATKIKGKLTALQPRPYEYITNDGRVYFQM